MNQLLLDGHSLVGIVSSIIRQTELHVAYNRMDWERIYRIADYHKVANIVYLGILGYRESVPPKWQERFFTRYQESLRNCARTLLYCGSGGYGSFADLSGREELYAGQGIFN